MSEIKEDERTVEGAGSPEEAEDLEASVADQADEGWPRSWIVVTAVLGIVAIIIVARMIGSHWHLETMEDLPKDPQAQPDPDPVHEPGLPPPPPATPPADGSGSQVLLDVKNVKLPPKHSCIGTDGKAHVTELGKLPPIPCQLAVRGSSFRLEIQRGNAQDELPVWLAVVLKNETGHIFHAMLLPDPGRKVPVWFASNLANQERLAVVVQALSGAPTLDRVRFIVKK